MNCQDDKGRIEMIAGTESALMSLACFFAAFRNGNFSHSYENLQFDQHRGGILVFLPTIVLEDMEASGLYDDIRLADYNLVFCLLPLTRSQ